MTLEFTYWLEGDHHLGYLNEFPDYWTQGDTLENLKEHLVDLYADLSSGEIPGIRRVATLQIA